MTAAFGPSSGAGLRATSINHLTMLLCGIVLLAGCTKEPVARTVTELLENPIMLEATMVRCAQDRVKTKYDAQCVNAREAVKYIEVKEEAVRRADFDARSDKKRQALRRAREAVAESRRRSSEAERLRQEAEYLAQFGAVPPIESEGGAEEDTGNTPMAIIPKHDEPPRLPPDYEQTSVATDGGNAPTAVVEPIEEKNDSDD